MKNFGDLIIVIVITCIAFYMGAQSQKSLDRQAGIEPARGKFF